MTEFPVIEEGNLLEREARQFHRKNPHVFDTCESLAAKAIARQGKIGIGAIWEKMRWEVMMGTIEIGVNPDTGEPLKLNNNYRAYYARWLLYKHPHWADALHIRHTRTYRRINDERDLA